MMEEAKAMAQQQQQQQQQQQLLFQQNQQQQSQQQQHQHQQQFMLLQQQLQKQHQLQSSSAISRFPSNIDAHLRPIRPPSSINVNAPNPNPNSSPSPNPQNQPMQNQNQNQNQNQQQRAIRGSNHVEVQMAYQDAWRVSHPDFKRPFSSLHDACDRLLAYHVVADYEAEEDDRILDSDTTGQMPSRSQQWDHNISAKVAEFTATFEKQALAFNIISRKRAQGEFRSEERMMIEQAMCQEEKRAYLDLKAELESREKAKMRMAEQARAELMSRGPIRANALGAQGSDMSPLAHHHQLQHHHGGDEMVNGWGSSAQRDEKEPSEDFLNDEETENGETSTQDDAWRDTAEFDLNTR